MSAADSNTSPPEKKSGYTFGHNETLLLISLYQKYEGFFSDVSYNNIVCIARDSRDLFPLLCIQDCQNIQQIQKSLPSFFLFIYKENCCDNGCNGSLFVGRHICYAMFTHARTAHLDGRFSYVNNPNYLFLAFRTNHSYSRIVDKKTRPKVLDHRTYERYLSSNRHRKASKFLAVFGIGTLDFYDADAVLYQLKYEANWQLVTL